MELKVNRPALAGQDIDPDTFQRVWDRVMPNQASPAAREGDSPSVPDTALPAEPSVPPTEAPPAQPELPPVPECPPDTSPDLPAVPDCPAQPETPPQAPSDCPQCPECPTVPGTTPAPEPPALCLGESSQRDAARLEELMTLAQAGAAAGRALARRASGTCARTLSALARDHRSAFRRLSAAYFLITGKRYAPKCPSVTLPASLALALRQQFVWEQQWEQKNNQAAQATADPCLKELYLELAQEGAFHAGTIRSLLEQMT
ncbi:MAG: hypothetical protein HFF44_04620 [Lawsonibacter sp.]|nr:hypothetical protein [Lawsonibacter sp.]